MKKAISIIVAVFLVLSFSPYSFAVDDFITCAECGRSIPFDSAFCPYCGKKVVEETESNSSTTSNTSGIENDFVMLDPLGLTTTIGLTTNEIIDSMLKEGVDYTKEDNIIDLKGFEQDSFSTYSLRSSCSFFGIQEENITPQIQANYYDHIISVVQYQFRLKTSEINRIVNTLEAIENHMDKPHWELLYRKWLYLHNPTIESDISFNKMYSEISRESEGSYLVQWISEEYRVTLHFDLDPSKQYSIGYLAISTTENYQKPQDIKTENICVQENKYIDKLVSFPVPDGYFLTEISTESDFAKVYFYDCTTNLCLYFVWGDDCSKSGDDAVTFREVFTFDADDSEALEETQAGLVCNDKDNYFHFPFEIEGKKWFVFVHDENNYMSARTYQNGVYFGFYLDSTEDMEDFSDIFWNDVMLYIYQMEFASFDKVHEMLD